MIAGKFEMRRRIVRIPVRAEPQVFINPVGPHDFVRVHFPLRVPDGFELAERLDQLGTKHLGQELGARLTIPMLARQ